MKSLKNKITKFTNNYLIKNTLILIITSLFIKVLSLSNRVFITRFLGNEGISLYVLVLPTISLLMSLGGFSLNVTVAKIVSENTVTKEYHDKTILKKAITIGLIVTALTIFTYIFCLRFITYNLLKQPKAYYPLLLGAIIIPFVTMNNVYRGFYNGLDKVKISALASLIEQISRLLFSILLLYLFKNYDLVVNVTITIIAMAFGEIISLFYSVSKVNKYLKEYNDEKDSKKLNRKLFSLSFSSSLSHLIANVSFFLEPIIYTYALGKLAIDNETILYKYGEVNAYAIPLLLMFLFTSSAMATVLIPSVSRDYQKKDLSSLVNKALVYAILPGIFLGIILYFFGKDYMLLLYDVTIGVTFVRKFALIFALFYLQPILIGLLQAIGKQKNLLYLSIFDSVFKLSSIYFLSQIKMIGYKSLIYSIVLTNIIATIILYLYVKKIFKVKFSWTIMIKLITILILTFYTIYILKYLNINYIVITIGSLLIFIFYIYLLRFIGFHNEK